MSRNPLAFGVVAFGLIGAVGLTGAVGCAAAGGAPAPARQAAQAAQAVQAVQAVHAAKPARAAIPAAAPSGCPTPPPRRAFAAQISAAGSVTWQVRLPTDPVQEGISLPPLVIGRTAVFAEENALYALRRGDGHQVWKRAFAKIGSDPFVGMVYGLWQWRGSVIALVGQVSAHSRLYSLNSATGAVNWALSLGRQGELGSQTLTAAGGLAMIRGQATLTVVDLATGRIRWAKTGVRSTGPVAAGGVVIAAVPGQIRGYGSRTGQLLWTRTGMPDQASLLATAGRVIVTDDTQNVFPPVPLWPVTALSPATGRTLWRTATGTPLYGQSAGPSGVAVVNSGRQLILINAVTGHVRWRVHDADSQLPADSGTDVFFVNGPAAGNGKLALVDVRAATGSVRWSVPAPGSSNGPVVTFGGLAVVFEDTASGLIPQGVLAASRITTGKHAWTVKLPTFLQVPPVAAGADLLVQPTDPGIGCALTGTASSS